MSKRFYYIHSIVLILHFHCTKYTVLREIKIIYENNTQHSTMHRSTSGLLFNM